jgi:SSS family solute:Na+ symporter
MVFAAVWATQIEQFGSLFRYLQNVLSYIAPPVVAVFLLGVFWRRATAQGAFVSLMTGFLLGVVLLVLNLTVWEQGLHFLYVGTLLFLLCSLVHVFVSLVTPAPAPETASAFTWSREQYQLESRELKELSWFSNYRVLSLALLFITAVVVIAYW